MQSLLAHSVRPSWIHHVSSAFQLLLNHNCSNNSPTAVLDELCGIITSGGASQSLTPRNPAEALVLQRFAYEVIIVSLLKDVKSISFERTARTAFSTVRSLQCVLPQASATNVASDLVLKQKKLFQSSDSDRPTVPQLAAAVGCTAQELRRAFLEQEGLTPRNYLLQIRLAGATDLLRRGIKTDAVAKICRISKATLYKYAAHEIKIKNRLHPRAKQ